MTEGFADAEYDARVAAAQARMAEEGLGALLLTDAADFRYFSGFLTAFWESPCRPWFLVVPAEGAPVAVVPTIGAPVVARCRVGEVRDWDAPAGDGIGLLADTLRELAGGAPVGLPAGPGTKVRMPLADLDRLRAAWGLALGDDRGIVAALRAVKSPAEIDRIAAACTIAGRAFDRVGEVAAAGVSLTEVFRGFQRLLLEEGADGVPYLAGGAGPHGYADVISPAAAVPLQLGDVLMLDTGAVSGGYFCDFDRNFAVGAVASHLHDVHARLVEAAQAGLAAARPGARACDVCAAMARELGGFDGGRLGHGLGFQLTEGLSLMPGDETVLRPGMVVTLEPVTGVTRGRIMVHEEVIAITEDAPRALSPLAGPRMPEI
ncbi:M24 family metallopeptidase [Roseovarius salinarum]|uniref:M24 family metallopeptidase n=1 Tax=Roseovarius salinarum TaxID=1981892 RepID=UPI000C336765|nr:Xaa-Pro peptidase family protein [Roseovarius salinarum]